jgi:2-polyprenyl-6-methoxyphenol hydroxylase-like FAD-dependent oxidoreductase
LAMSDPKTVPLVSQQDTLTIWFADDRRVVMYPCQDNQWLNFVCIHPDDESHTTSTDGKPSPPSPYTKSNHVYVEPR